MLSTYDKGEGKESCGRRLAGNDHFAVGREFNRTFLNRPCVSRVDLEKTWLKTTLVSAAVESVRLKPNIVDPEARSVVIARPNDNARVYSRN